MKKLQNQEWFKLNVSKDATEATILIYGLIGPNFNWATETEEGATDIDFVQTLTDLAKSYSKINIRLNSPGGSVKHGWAMITAMQSCSAEVHTWNDGMVGSMAADIWLAGQIRHMAKGAMLMIHAPQGVCEGPAQKMRETADVLDKISEAAIAQMQASTGLDATEISTKFYDGNDHWLTRADCVKQGFLTDEDEYESGQNVPVNATKMSHTELFNFWKQLDHTDEPPASWWKEFTETVRQFLEKKPIDPPAQSPDIQKNEEMNFEEFKKAMAEDAAFSAQVKEHLAPPPAAPPKPEDDEETEFHKKQTAEIQKLTSLVDGLTKKVAELGAQPGASRSTPAAPEIDPTTLPVDALKVEVETFNKKLAEKAMENF